MLLEIFCQELGWIIPGQVPRLHACPGGHALEIEIRYDKLIIGEKNLSQNILEKRSA